VSELVKENKYRYIIIDELYTFIKKKDNKAYIWSAIAVKLDGSVNFFYHLSDRKNAQALKDFNESLPEVDTVYCDGNMSYNSVFGDRATMQKSKVTNIIENLNSQLRDNLSYLVRKSKTHSKNRYWFNNRLAFFFLEKNLIF
jgi:IS1 family transposase